MDRPQNGLPEDLREHTRLMCDVIALAFQTDKTRIASLLLARDLSSLYYPFLDVREGHHGASHDDLSDGYERISRFHLSQLAYLAGKLDAMPEGEGTVLDNCCLLWLSNMWAGWKHDNMKLPVVLAGGLGGTLETGRALDYLYAGDDNRKLCSLYLSIMDRMGVTLDRFGDADTRLSAGFVTATAVARSHEDGRNRRILFQCLTESSRRLSTGRYGSEHELQAELQQPRIAGDRNRPRDGPEVGAVDGDPVVARRRARDVEVHLVEDVEELGAELNVHIAAEAEVLEQPHVPAVERRPAQIALGDVAERADVGHREGRRVEPQRLGPNRLAARVVDR